MLFSPWRTTKANWMFLCRLITSPRRQLHLLLNWMLHNKPQSTLFSSVQLTVKIGMLKLVTILSVEKPTAQQQQLSQLVWTFLRTRSTAPKTDFIHFGCMSLIISTLSWPQANWRARIWQSTLTWESILLKTAFILKSRNCFINFVHQAVAMIQ